MVWEYIHFCHNGILPVGTFKCFHLLHPKIIPLWLITSRIFQPRRDFLPAARQRSMSRWHPNGTFSLHGVIRCEKKGGHFAKTTWTPFFLMNNKPLPIRRMSRIKNSRTSQLSFSEAGLGRFLFISQGGGMWFARDFSMETCGKTRCKAKLLTVQWTDTHIWKIMNYVYNMDTREQTRTWNALNTHTIDI